MHSRCKDYLKIKQTCSVTQTLNASKQAGRQATKQASTQVSEQGSKQMRMNNQASQRKTPTTKNWNSKQDATKRTRARTEHKQTKTKWPIQEKQIKQSEAKDERCWRYQKQLQYRCNLIASFKWAEIYHWGHLASFIDSSAPKINYNNVLRSKQKAKRGARACFFLGPSVAKCLLLRAARRNALEWCPGGPEITQNHQKCHLPGD